MDLLWLVQKIPFCPAIFTEENMIRFGEKVAIPDPAFPRPAFALKRLNSNGRSVPHAIAHRGVTAKYPENTIKAFEEAVGAGAQAIETDLHLSRDGVVVLSHDPDLKRCFGVHEKIKNYDWKFLKTLRSTRSPHEPLACLHDILELLQTSKCQDTWLMLDIKIDDDPDELMRHVAETLKQVDPGSGLHWKNRVMLGCWTAKCVSLCSKYFPGFSAANIGFSTDYSRQFLTIQSIGFVMLQPSHVSPNGRNFIKDVQSQDRQIFSWTVSDKKNMDWCIKRGFDGVVTDDVPTFLQMCEDPETRTYRWPISLVLGFAYFNIWVFIFNLIYRRRYGTSLLERTVTDKDK